MCSSDLWGVISLSLYGAALFSLGWALIAVYLVLVNAVVHIVHAILFRRYNPGLFTALVLFLPMGVITLVLIDRAGGGSIKSHSVGFVTAVAIHAAILMHVRRKLLAMQRIQGSGAA